MGAECKYKYFMFCSVDVAFIFFYIVSDAAVEVRIRIGWN